MATQNILPTLQADEKSAQLRLHPVPIHNGLIDAGRMLTDAGQGLQKASFGLMIGLRRRQEELQTKEDNLLLAEAKNRYLSAMTTKETELDKRTGKEAAGSTKEIQDTSITARDKAGQIIQNSDQLRAFNIWADQQSLSYSTRQQKREYANVNGAEIEQRNQVISNDQKNYVLSGDAHDLDMLILDAQDQYVATFGGNQDVGAMNQYVQTIVDETIGKRLDNLFKEGKLEEGIAYFDSLGKNGVPDLSEQEKKAAEFVVNKQRDLLNVRNEVIYLGNGTISNAGPYSYGGMYHTPEQDYHRMQVEAELGRRTDPLAKVRLAEYQKYMDNLEKVQDARLTAQYVENTRDLGKGVTYESRVQDFITLSQRRDAIPQETLLYGKMTDTLVRAYASLVQEEDHIRSKQEHADSLWRQQQNAEEQRYKDLENNKDRQALVAGVMMSIQKSNPSVRYNGIMYDLSDHDTLETFLYEASWRQGGILSDRDISHIRDYMGGGVNAEYRNEAALAITEVVNRGLKENERLTTWQIIALDPSLPDDVLDYMKYLSGTKGKLSDTDNKLIEEYIAYRMAEQRGNNTWLPFDDNRQTRANAYQSAIGKDGSFNVNAYQEFIGVDQTQTDYTSQQVGLSLMGNASAVVPEDTAVVTARAEKISAEQYDAKQAQKKAEKAQEKQTAEEKAQAEEENARLSQYEEGLLRSAETAVRNGESSSAFIARVREERRRARQAYPFLSNMPEYRDLTIEDENNLTKIYRRAQAEYEPTRRRAEFESRETARQNQALAVDAIDKGIKEQELRIALIQQFGMGAATKEDEKRVEDVLDIYRKLKREGRGEQIRNNAIDMNQKPFSRYTWGQ